MWDDPVVDWSAYDLVVLRSTWDYTDKVDAFLDWTRSVPRLLNDADVVDWNHDKRYLAALHAAGVPTVPTRWGPCDLPDGRWVVKPRIGAGARGITVVEGPASIDGSHFAQPYLDGVDEHGETAIVYLGDDFSHAARKEARLGLDKVEETVVPWRASTDEHELAEQVLDTIPFDRGELLYARVDLVPGPEGDPVLLELELIEPSLFVDTVDDGRQRFLDAVFARL
ncbi:MAG TPA: hypothetical protein VFU93_05185 [Acidimicrobiales bacterium]|nr:hypothetical protein [Acidimicrobiales bacterium]